jgi:hypothetical protein
MPDVFNVTASYDKGSYTQGQTITITISGTDVLTTTTTGQIGPLTIPIVAADGATSTINVPAEQVTITAPVSESVVIDTTKAIVDTSPKPRTWAVATNKLSISAVA